MGEHTAANSVEGLSERIAVLVGERQALRAEGADADALERNRVEIASLQRALAHALIERFKPAAA